MLVRAAAALRALVLATTPSVAVPQGPEASSFETFVRFIRNTDPGSNARMPGLTIPAGLGPTTGQPVGVSLDGLPDSDERLLAVGLAIERVLGRTPPPKRSLTVGASPRGTLVAIRVIGGRFRGGAARAAALDHGRRRAAARRRRARRRRGRPRVALAALPPPGRHAVGRLTRKRARRRRRLGRPHGVARRLGPRLGPRRSRVRPLDPRLGAGLRALRARVRSRRLEARRRRRALALDLTGAERRAR